MPHVNVRLYPGRTEEQKRALTERIVEAFRETMGIDAKWVSLVIEEVAPEDWDATVVEPEIRAKDDALYKKPDYLDA